MRIVLAHGDGLTLAGIRHALEDDGGFEVVGEAHIGPDVPALVAATAPDVVLLDLGMPVVGGIECLRLLRVETPNVKVVLCSMSSSRDAIQEAFTYGASGFVLESINPLDLGPAIRQATASGPSALLRLPGSAEETSARAAGLTEREVEVLQAVARGLSNKAIAAELSVSLQTVKFHLTSIFRKLGITNRTEAARWALAHALSTTHDVQPSDDKPE
jgi:DNA-binding NarL/FixJ family response regulator